MGFIVAIIIIAGIIAGIYWYRIVDLPREKYIKLDETSREDIILDMRPGMYHHISNNINPTIKN